jgi:hypothetical protein
MLTLAIVVLLIINNMPQLSERALNMLKIVTFQGHTISARSILLGDRRWGACYTVCDSGTLVQNSREVVVQSSVHGAEIAAIIQGIHYVQRRLAGFHNRPGNAH